VKHAFSPVFRFNLLIIFTLFPVALRAQALDLSTKNTFAMHEESNFPLETRCGMSFVSRRLNGTRPLSRSPSILRYGVGQVRSLADTGG